MANETNEVRLNDKKYLTGKPGKVFSHSSSILQFKKHLGECLLLGRIGEGQLGQLFAHRTGPYQRPHSDTPFELRASSERVISHSHSQSEGSSASLFSSFRVAHKGMPPLYGSGPLFTEQASEVCGSPAPSPSATAVHARRACVVAGFAMHRGRAQSTRLRRQHRSEAGVSEIVNLRRPSRIFGRRGHTPPSPGKWHSLTSANP